MEDKDCQFKCGLVSRLYNRAKQVCPLFSIWSGGVSTSKQFGELFITGKCDFVESEAKLVSDVLLGKDESGGVFYWLLCDGLSCMESLAKSLASAVSKYCKTMGIKPKTLTGKAERMFWQKVDAVSNDFLDACGEDKNSLDVFLSGMKRRALDVYDQVCAHGSARQMLTWMNNRYLSYGAKNGKKG